MNDTTVQTDTAREQAYWRSHFRNRSYVTSDDIYDDYGPAFSYGIDAYGRYDGRRFEDVESELARDWDKFKGQSKLTWERAKGAVRDAWNRLTD